MVGLGGLEPPTSSLSAIGGSPLCNPAFSQVVRDRKGRSNALFERGQRRPGGSASKSSRTALATLDAWCPCSKMPLPCTDPVHLSLRGTPFRVQQHLRSTCPRPPTNALAITDDSHRLALLSTPTFSEDSSADPARTTLGSRRGRRWRPSGPGWRGRPRR